jgi:hypothetical protein
LQRYRVRRSGLFAGRTLSPSSEQDLSGEAIHKGNSFPGEHKAIIENLLWDAVQSELTENRTKRASGTNTKAPSLLTGLLFDETGERLTPRGRSRRALDTAIMYRRRLLRAADAFLRRGGASPPAILKL